MPPCTSFDDFDDVPDAKSPLSISAGAQAPARGVERDPAAGDAAADDEDVERLLGEPVQSRCAIERHCTRLPRQ